MRRSVEEPTKRHRCHFGDENTTVLPKSWLYVYSNNTCEKHALLRVKITFCRMYWPTSWQTFLFICHLQDTDFIFIWIPEWLSIVFSQVGKLKNLQELTDLGGDATKASLHPPISAPLTGLRSFAWPLIFLLWKFCYFPPSPIGQNLETVLDNAYDYSMNCILSLWTGIPFTLRIGNTHWFMRTPVQINPVELWLYLFFPFNL